ncbi:phosphatidylinositol N-acetylglucosaminyltransferase subunit, putative [Candida dubliniensis CD36]|uniref:Phosphatidylinositol N-acetylglucosaminyltransferase subunit, putative n=1 Tax=Candida dubliniensis (strain CD36 / ATCC MYA-646 / CBS 7987 / NCPF 3949 / NRRL Y-17841) TaxID=573826 RepID=B9WEC7_CANDC|nr:phosphatidylinositol N-acetylglucosaminyltransferase subunit, putative [Candida dubliniensis CD36]CAX43038.1 phosphatidylinositol N-acetylglucosaminyltransferase subunit, putative [Candida dubliniensis CD36]
MNSTQSAHPLQIYFPNDLKTHYQDQGYWLGYKLNNIYIVFSLVFNDKDLKLPPELSDLTIIGTHNHNKKTPKQEEGDNYYDLHLIYDNVNQLLINQHQTSYLIYFDPPNFQNLEYFSITPILLQSMGPRLEKCQDYPLFDKLKQFEYQKLHATNKNQSFISDDLVLDKINHLYRNRLLYKRFHSNRSFSALTPQKFNFFIIQNIIIPIIIFIQKLLIILITIINYKVLNLKSDYDGLSLVGISRVFRQLDLRLKQFNYFPTQFLCYYYDKNILYSENSLKLPIFNDNLNINNSNYINLYNSIWLIFNDILIGVTLYHVIMDNFESIIKFIRLTIMEKYLFMELMKLITWISTENPAGFKLNTDLGKFLGDLYIWTIGFCQTIVMKLDRNSSDSFNYILLIDKILKVLCYYGGCSFLLSFLIDGINLITLHIYGFYYCSAKIYRRQLEIIKSLFQLFRGKKYNVLRNRIDNLNNYELDSNTNCANDNSNFEIDQLLLGTLLFMMMIFLLPTVFAFYLVFFIMHLLILMSFNLLENLQIIICFIPLFVILLKLKNSKRLQGGIKFEFIRFYQGMTILKLSNKSLTYQEIFINFIKLFRGAKNFRDSILWKFLLGQIVKIKYDNNLKFHYLMLPQEYSETINIWKFVKQ